MEFIFLGTGAADFPFPFPEDRFDDNARRSSSVLFCGNTLFDCGIHTLKSLEILKKPLNEIENIFISHTHMDHFSIENIAKIAKSRTKPLNLYVNKGATANFETPKNVNLTEMVPFTKYELEDFAITGLPANHDSKSFPQHFVCEKDSKKFFYGLDGGWLLHESYYFLKDKKLDLMILDSTSGDYEGDYRMGEHNSIPMIRLMLASFKTFKVIDENSKIVLSHIAPSLHKPHSETTEIAEKFGAIVAFDGMELSI